LNNEIERIWVEGTLRLENFPDIKAPKRGREAEGHLAWLRSRLFLKRHPFLHVATRARGQSCTCISFY